MVAAFFSDISQLSFVLSPPDVYPCQYDCLLLCSWWKVGLMTSTPFSGGHTSPQTTYSIPHDQTPSTNHCLAGLRHHYLSLDYLMSSDTAQGPITIFGPFIPKNIVAWFLNVVRHWLVANLEHQSMLLLLILSSCIYIAKLFFFFNFFQKFHYIL